MSSQNEIKQAKLEKLRAEIHKLKAETEQVNRSPYHFSNILKYVIYAILTIPVVWFYFKEIALPLNRIEIIQNEVNSSQLELKYIKTYDSLERAKKQFTITKRRFLNDLKVATDQNKELLVNLNRANKKLQNLQIDFSDCTSDLSQLKTIKKSIDSVNRSAQVSITLQNYFSKELFKKAEFDFIELTPQNPFYQNGVDGLNYLTSIASEAEKEIEFPTGLYTLPLADIKATLSEFAEVVKDVEVLANEGQFELLLVATVNSMPCRDCRMSGEFQPNEAVVYMTEEDNLVATRYKFRKKLTKEDLAVLRAAFIQSVLKEHFGIESKVVMPVQITTNRSTVTAVFILDPEIASNKY